MRKLCFLNKKGDGHQGTLFGPHVNGRLSQDEKTMFSFLVLFLIEELRVRALTRWYVPVSPAPFLVVRKQETGRKIFGWSTAQSTHKHDNKMEKKSEKGRTATGMCITVVRC